MKKVLVANRGEIAVRIIKACKELALNTVAVYSEADRTAPHVHMADEAICIGPPPPLESYLNIDKIIKVAIESRADSLHPGYGFLAENSLFVRRCEAENLTFIGPNSRAMKLVGDKIQSRKTISRAGIPIIPGMKHKCGAATSLRTEAEKIGYPVIVKASAGGGGKGMRVAHTSDELIKAVEAGRREAKKAFGDETVYLEKYIEEPRHVEFQVLADNHGRVIHLFERECSIQRRHQKIIEETPSSALDNALRSRMGEAAVKAVKTCGYTNAGTVEFLLDRNKNFYFLEVNARIQVEHPITELVTGVDLVKQQIQIAAGESLAIRQEDLSQRGHAIECRIYAEDPESNFLPSLGKILFLHSPEGGGIRVDSGIYPGAEVTMFYDPLLAKLIVWGENREHARKRMVAALSDYVILGIKTQIPFLKAVLEHREFLRGNTTTDFIPSHMREWNSAGSEYAFENALIVAAINSTNRMQNLTSTAEKRVFSPWRTLGQWEIGGNS